MDKHFFFKNSLDPSHKLTKSASFTELSTSRKLIVEKNNETLDGDKFFRKYHCGQVTDNKNAR